MFNYIWPIALVVLSNTFYQFAAKSVPQDMNPFASLTVTYLVGAAASFVMFKFIGGGSTLAAEYAKLNWAPFVLGLVIIGLEAGYIYAYKVGWPVSIAQITQAALLSGILILAGHFVYGEPITWNKIVGVIICLTGLGLINLK